MAYQKTEIRSFIAAKIIFGTLMFVGLVFIAYFVWFGATNESSEVTVTQGDGGKIAQLTNDQFVAGARTDQSNEAVQTQGQESPEPESSSTNLSDEPYTMNLPTGWTMTNTSTQPNPCDPNVEETVTTYTNADEVLTIYVNGDATGCNNATIGDVYYDFDYSTDGSSIIANTAVNPPFCTKDINPTCPKGDGKVTVFVGNSTSENNTVQETNTITGKTYYFTIVDSSVEPNLDAQGASLAKLVESIQIN